MANSLKKLRRKLIKKRKSIQRIVTRIEKIKKESEQKPKNKKVQKKLKEINDDWEKDSSDQSLAVEPPRYKYIPGGEENSSLDCEGSENQDLIAGTSGYQSLARYKKCENCGYLENPSDNFSDLSDLTDDSKVVKSSNEVKENNGYPWSKNYHMLTESERDKLKRLNKKNGNEFVEEYSGNESLINFNSDYDLKEKKLAKRYKEIKKLHKKIGVLEIEEVKKNNTLRVQRNPNHTYNLKQNREDKLVRAYELNSDNETYVVRFVHENRLEIWPNWSQKERESGNLPNREEFYDRFIDDDYRKNIKNLYRHVIEFENFFHRETLDE